MRGHGSCRDFAWLEVAALAPARLRGALRVGLLDPAQARREAARRRPAGVAEDVADLHAWAEVYLPGAGWIGLDATSGLLAGEGHIPLACTAGAVDGGADQRLVLAGTATTEDDKVAEEFTFEMRVRRVDEAPRVTKPYREDQWAAIDALGTQVDRDLERLRRPADDGRRADLRLDRRSRRARVEHRRARADQAACSPTGCCGGCARASRRAASCTTARGSGTRASRCRAGRYSCYFRRDGEPIWHEPGAVRAGDPDAAPTDADRPPQGFVARAGATGWGSARSSRCPPTRTPSTICGASAGCPSNVNVLREQARRSDRARAPGARVRRRARRGGRLRAAAAPADSAGDRVALGERPLVAARRSPLPACPATRRWGIGCRSTASPGRPRRRGSWVHERDPLVARPPLGPTRPPRAAAAASRRTPCRQRPTASRRRATSCAPPSASSRARGCCTSSCRRSSFLEEYLALVAAVEDVAREREQPVRHRGLPPAHGLPPRSRCRSRPIRASSR